MSVKVTVNSTPGNRVALNTQQRETIRTVTIGSGSGGSMTLEGLDDVNATGKANNYVLVYDSVTQTYVVKAAPAMSLESLTDVVSTGKANNFVLVYNAPTQKYVVKAAPAMTLESLTDVDSSGKANNYTLVYNAITQKYVVKEVPAINLSLINLSLVGL
jgi:hypothetical protein